MAIGFVGSCLCGCLGYQASDQPIDAGYCHRRMCQRSAGAPTLVWATFKVEAFSYTQGRPSIYRSSDHSQREFCDRCGTQVAFRKVEAATTVDVTVASLDDPAQIKPEYHVWLESKISWLHVADDLLRYQDDGPDIE